MLENFYITAFIFVPVSLLLVITGVVIVASPDSRNRLPLRSWNLWFQSVFMIVIGTLALRAIPSVTAGHAALLMFSGACFFSAGILYIAGGVRNELERRVGPVKTGHSADPGYPHSEPHKP